VILIFNLKVKILIKKQNWTKPEKKNLGNTFFFPQNEWKICQEVGKKHLKMKPIKNNLKKGKKPSKFE
jgi:hypothetical protein